MLNQHLEELLYRGSLGGQANFYFNLKEKNTKVKQNEPMEKEMQQSQRISILGQVVT